MIDPILDLVGWMTARAPWKLLDRFLHVRTQFRELSSNARTLILTSFFWTLPFAFSAVYLRIFMKEQGLSAIEIGTISSIQVMFQVIGSFCGGYVADRLGWKRSLIAIDFLLWPAVLLTYATSTSYSGFLIGACLEGLQWTVSPAWISLLVTGTAPSRRPFLFALSGLHFMGGGLLVPFAAPLIRTWGVSSTSRVMLAAGAVLTMTGILIRLRTVRDTTPPAARRVPAGVLADFMHGHRQALRAIIARPGLRLMFLYWLVIRIAMIVWFTYGYLYLTDPRGLGFDKARISILPLINSAMVVASLLFVNARIGADNIHRFFYAGLALRMVYQLTIIVAPAGAMYLVMGAMVAEGLGFGILWSTTNAYWANQMKDSERPRITALANVLFLLITMPVPAIAGAFYVLNPRLPFVGMLALFATAFAMQVRMDLRDRARKRPGSTA